MAAITREWHVTELAPASMPVETVQCLDVRRPLRGIAIDNVSNCKILLYAGRSAAGLPSATVPSHTLKALPIECPFITIAVSSPVTDAPLGDIYVHLTEEVLQPYAAASVADPITAIFDRTSFDDGSVRGT